MCNSPQYYVCHVMKEVPGDNNRFVIAHTVPGRFNSAQARMPLQQVSLAQLCNDNKSSRVKFVI